MMNTYSSLLSLSIKSRAHHVYTTKIYRRFGSDFWFTPITKVMCGGRNYRITSQRLGNDNKWGEERNSSSVIVNHV